MSTAPAAPPTTTTTDADMVDQEADALLGANRTVMDDYETSASPTKRSRKVSRAMTMAAMDSHPLGWSVLALSRGMHARPSGSVTARQPTVGPLVAGAGKKTGVMHQVTTESNREQARASESKREQARASESKRPHTTAARSARRACTEGSEPEDDGSKPGFERAQQRSSRMHLPTLLYIHHTIQDQRSDHPAAPDRSTEK